MRWLDLRIRLSRVDAKLIRIHSHEVPSGTSSMVFAPARARPVVLGGSFRLHWHDSPSLAAIALQ